MAATPERKPVEFIGRARDEIRAFPDAARQEAGYQIDYVQRGGTPRDSKPMPDVGRGVREIRIAEDDGWFRVFYVASFGDAVWVLHGFRKKTRTTPQQAIETGKKRYRQAMSRAKDQQDSTKEADQ